jgi:hypothetical protein
MQMIGRAHDYSIYIFLLLEQFSEVVVGRAFFILARTLLRTVVAFHDLLGGLAAGHAAGDLERMGELNRLIGAEPLPTAVDSDQLAHGIAELVVAPLRVAGTAFVDVADRHALHIGLAQEMKHHA